MSGPTSRRSFLQVPAVAAASAFLIVKPELVRGAGKERLRAGIIGTGGRGCPIRSSRRCSRLSQTRPDGNEPCRERKEVS